MTRPMKSCFVTLTFIFLWRLQEGAEACSCINIDPKQALCNADVVLKARVTGKHEVDQNSMKSIKFDINVIKVFKGPQAIDAVYTSGPCRAFLDTNGGKPYLITGRLEAGKVQIIMCNLIKQWDDLSAAQLSLVQDSKHYCG